MIDQTNLRDDLLSIRSESSLTHDTDCDLQPSPLSRQQRQARRTEAYHERLERERTIRQHRLQLFQSLCDNFERALTPRSCDSSSPTMVTALTLPSTSASTPILQRRESCDRENWWKMSPPPENSAQWHAVPGLLTQKRMETALDLTMNSIRDHAKSGRIWVEKQGRGQYRIWMRSAELSGEANRRLQSNGDEA